MKLITTIAKPRPAMTLSALALSMAIAPSPVNAQEVINLTVGSSHPTTIPWVGMIPDVFIKR